MKPVQKYQCEVCRVEYAKKEDALDCEKNHKIPQSIVSARHMPKAQKCTGYPVTVTIRMSNGKEIVYKQ